ncbi:MAG: hypothetical protein HWE30_01625 [Methylocystaceae bacterium]|nr:hypothetical protein [Methylocystaceae bacterium]
MSDLKTLVKSGQWEEVIETLDEKWASSEPTALECFYRSLAAFKIDDYFSAYNLALQAFEMDGESAEISSYLSSLCVLVGKVKDSYFYRKILSTLSENKEIQETLPDGIIPDYTDLLEQLEEKPLLHLATKHELYREWDLAEHWYQQYIAFEPHDRDGYISLVRCQISQERFRAASENLKGARAIFPVDTAFAGLLGDVLGELGQHQEAEACHQWAIDCDETDSQVYVRYLRSMIANPQHDFNDCVMAFDKWQKQYVAEIKGAIPVTQLGERLFLRVGFIVTGLDRGRVAPALGAVLSWYDENKFEFIGYGEGDLTNPLNRYFKTSFKEWRDVSDTDSMTLFNMVRADGIDILINLSGMASTETLLCFGSRLAPVQILWAENTLPGCLPEFDYVVSDRCQEELASKHLPLEGSSVFVARREVLDNDSRRKDDRFSFLADASLSKLTLETASVWAKILLLNPDTMLLLRSHDFYAEDNSRALIELFGLFGVAHRIDIIEESDRRDFFAQGDVVLLPTNGESAEIVVDALCCSKPVFGSIENDYHLSSGVDLINALGLGDDLVFDTNDKYIEAVSKYVQNPAQHQVLEEKIKASFIDNPFFDEKQRMRHIETMLTSLWQKVCAQGGA